MMWRELKNDVPDGRPEAPNASRVGRNEFDLRGAEERYRMVQHIFRRVRRIRGTRSVPCRTPRGRPYILVQRSKTAGTIDATSNAAIVQLNVTCLPGEVRYRRISWPKATQAELLAAPTPISSAVKRRI